MAPDGEVKEGFKFPMNRKGSSEFRQKIPLETGIRFKVSGSAYAGSKFLHRVFRKEWMIYDHTRERIWRLRDGKYLLDSNFIWSDFEKKTLQWNRSLQA